MTSLPQIERILHFFSLAAMLVLLIRLAYEKLHRTYPAFFGYLLFEIGRALVAIPMQTNRTNYAYFYIFSEPIVWVLYFLIVRELYGLVLRDHVGIATAGNKALTFGMVAAMVVTLLTLSPDLRNRGGLDTDLLMVFVIGRAIITTLAFFILIVSAFLAWFPVPLSRNSVYYVIGYAVLFLSKGTALLLRNVSDQALTQLFSVSNLLVADLCLAIWILKLNKAGKDVPVTIGHSWNPEDMEELADQLNTINRTLMGNRLGR